LITLPEKIGSQPCGQTLACSFCTTFCNPNFLADRYPSAKLPQQLTEFVTGAVP
jgi:hypothetical protein